MIEQAKANGVELRLVLFDAWYFCAEMAECLNDLELDPRRKAVEPG
jgi:hypothetical protein